MDIEGTFTLQATPQNVWHCLMDGDILRQIIPGLEQLEQREIQGKQQYSLTLAIRQGQLTGRYHTYLTIIEQRAPSSYRFVIEGEQLPDPPSSQTNNEAAQLDKGKFSGTGFFRLKARGNNTIIGYQGRLHFDLNTQGNFLPTILTKGVTRLLLQQFFIALADQLHTISISTTERAEVASNVASPLRGMVGGQMRAQVTGRRNGIVSSVPSAQPESDDQQESRLYGLVRRLRLGAGDPRQEAQWVKKARRFGIISVLLFLVWVGTRLPRR